MRRKVLSVEIKVFYTRIKRFIRGGCFIRGEKGLYMEKGFICGENVYVWRKRFIHGENGLYLKIFHL